SNGSANSIQARYLVDASGRTSVLGRQFRIKKTYDHLQKLSIFAHYDGVWRPEGIDGTLTVLIRAVDRWFWLIPLSDERTSVGGTANHCETHDERAACLEDLCRSRFLLSKRAFVRRSLVAYGRRRGI